MGPVGKHCESVQVLFNHNASPRQEEELIQGLRESIGPLQVSTDMFDVHLAVVVKSTHVVDRVREVLCRCMNSVCQSQLAAAIRDRTLRVANTDSVW